MPQFFGGMAIGALIPVVVGFAVVMFKDWVEGVASREALRHCEGVLKALMEKLKRDEKA